MQPIAPAQIEATKAKTRRKRKALASAAAFLLVAVSAGVYYAYQAYLVPPPPPALRIPPPVALKSPGPATAPTSTGSPGGVTSPNSPTAPTTTLGSLLDNVQTVLSERRGLEQARVDNFLNGKDPPSERALKTPPPGTLVPKSNQPTATTSSVATAGTVSPSVQTVVPPVAPVQSAPVGTNGSVAFKVWIENVHINGVVVRDGKVSVDINGTLVHPGDTLEPALGIVLDSVDNASAQHRLNFRDRTGTILSREY